MIRVLNHYSYSETWQHRMRESRPHPATCRLGLLRSPVPILISVFCAPPAATSTSRPMCCISFCSRGASVAFAIRVSQRLGFAVGGWLHAFDARSAKSRLSHKRCPSNSLLSVSPPPPHRPPSHPPPFILTNGSYLFIYRSFFPPPLPLLLILLPPLPPSRQMD